MGGVVSATMEERSYHTALEALGAKDLRTACDAFDASMKWSRTSDTSQLLGPVRGGKFNRLLRTRSSSSELVRSGGTAFCSSVSANPLACPTQPQHRSLRLEDVESVEEMQAYGGSPSVLSTSPDPVEPRATVLVQSRPAEGDASSHRSPIPGLEFLGRPELIEADFVEELSESDIGVTLRADALQDLAAACVFRLRVAGDLRKHGYIEVAEEQYLVLRAVSRRVLREFDEADDPRLSVLTFRDVFVDACFALALVALEHARTCGSDVQPMHANLLDLGRRHVFAAGRFLVERGATARSASMRDVFVIQARLLAEAPGADYRRCMTMMQRGIGVHSAVHGLHDDYTVVLHRELAEWKARYAAASPRRCASPAPVGGRDADARPQHPTASADELFVLSATDVL